MKPWHFRYARPLIYLGAAIAALGVAVSSKWDEPDFGRTLIGADFGFNRGPDVKGEADFGSLIGFLVVATAWLVLFLARRRGWRWMPMAPPRN